MQKFYTADPHGGGGGATTGSGCGGIESITWETPLESFMQASTVSNLVDEAKNCSLKDLNKNVIAVVEGEMSKGLSAEAFEYNGDAPLNTKAQALIDSMKEVDTSFLNKFTTEIQSIGDNHRYAEAYTSYCKRLEEYHRRYTEELCPAVKTYNQNVSRHNAQEMQKARLAGEKGETYSVHRAQKVSVKASQDSEPTMSGTINTNISGASKLQSAFDDCKKFYNEYVVPAKELHDECSKSEYVEPQKVPEFEFEKYPKEWYEHVADFALDTVGTIAQVGCVIIDGALHLGEMIYDGITWVDAHLFKGVVGGIVSMWTGKGFASGYKEVTEYYNKKIANPWADNVRESFYGTGFGKWIDKHSVFKHDGKVFKAVSTITTYTLPLVAATAATIFTGGAASPLLATVGGSAVTNLGIALGATGFAMGVGKTSQNVYQETGGKDTAIGTAKILGSGAITGAGYYFGGQQIASHIAKSAVAAAPTTPPTTPTDPLLPEPPSGGATQLTGTLESGGKMFPNGNKLYPTGILEYPDGSIAVDAVVDASGNHIGTLVGDTVVDFSGNVISRTAGGPVFADGTYVDAAGNVIGRIMGGTAGDVTVDAAGNIIEDAGSGIIP